MKFSFTEKSLAGLTEDVSLLKPGRDDGFKCKDSNMRLHGIQKLHEAWHHQRNTVILHYWPQRNGDLQSAQQKIQSICFKDILNELKEKTTQWSHKNNTWTKVLVTQLCPTLSDPMDCSRQAPLSMGFPRQEYWSWLPFTSPGDPPDPGTEPRSLALQMSSLPSEPPRKSHEQKEKFNRET